VDLFYSVQDFQAAYAQLILALKDMSQWPKYVAGRRKKQRFRCCIKNKNTTKKEKRTTFVPYICKGYDHHWHDCKEGDPDDIATIMRLR
jgi:hypothetical protein